MVSKQTSMMQFDVTTCCALREGFRKNPETLSFLQNHIPPSRIRMHQDILTNTKSLGFIPNHEQEQVFGAVAEAEVVRLRHLDETLNCTCSSSEHVSALQKVVEKLNPKGRG